MRKINKSSAPASLLSFCDKRPVEWSEIHKPENRHVYDDCLATCVDDQRNLCAYTEILLDEGTRHIDHYIKRSIDNRLTFEWSNMVAAVKDSKYGADWKDSHVTPRDYDADNKCYSNILNPVADDLAGRFVYHTDGLIAPSDDGDELAVNTIAVFNLNEPSLKSRRKVVMQSVRNMVASGISKEDVSLYLKSSGFHSVVEYELSFW